MAGLGLGLPTPNPGLFILHGTSLQKLRPWSMGRVGQGSGRQGSSKVPEVCSLA